MITKADKQKVDLSVVARRLPKNRKMLRPILIYLSHLPSRDGIEH